MKESTIYWTPFALSRLDEIHRYIAEEAKSPLNALKFVSKIIGRTDQLSGFPESGQAELLLQEIGQNSRYLVVNSYKIIYEYYPKKNLVIITDIFHTKQNPEKNFKKKKL